MSSECWSVAEKDVCPADQKSGDEVVTFPGHLAALSGVKSRAEVDEEESGEVTG